MSYAYPSSSIYEPQYESTYYSTYEVPSRSTSPQSFAKKNGTYCKYMASCPCNPQNVYESYESQYDCDYSAYDSQYDYEFSPCESQYAYDTSLGKTSQYRYDNSPPYEWRCNYETSPIYETQYQYKGSPVYESTYEYVYEWPMQQNESQPQDLFTPEYELPPNWNKQQKECKSPPGSNKPHDQLEPALEDTDDLQGLEDLPAVCRPAVGGKASLGHSEGVPGCVGTTPGNTVVALPPEEPGNSQQDQLPNGIRKQCLDGSEGLLGGMRKFLDGTKKLLCRGNQLYKEPIPEEGKWSKLPNINSPPQRGIIHLNGSPVLVDNSIWPKGERNLCIGRAIQPHHLRGVCRTRGGMTPHLPDISGRLWGRVNRVPGRGNFSPLPSHSRCSHNS
ncbi:uncharacterized protein LOC121918636 [Sceloporus undulatus]|uniref:uncharacterized protein LOC121918636 n=1 Tax=Sceloporus undulatus TaxID=8520 RepID=UPI001C4D2DED|nr:uncharacterized protein LOC121918636 [Sceloporus undulatus]